MKFLKNFALGLLWAFLSPLLLAILVIFGAYALFVYLIECGKCLIRFFQGKSFFPPLDEDIMVAKIKEREMKELLGEKEEEKKEETPAAPASQSVYVQQNFYQAPPMGGAPFPGYIPPYQGAIPPSVSQGTGPIPPLDAIPGVGTPIQPPFVDGSAETPPPLEYKGEEQGDKKQ